MKPKDVRTLILNHPNHELFLAQNGTVHNGTASGLSITFHDPVSKSTLIRYAKLLQGYRISTYAQERSDLGRYLQPQDYSRNIITFY